VFLGDRSETFEKSVADALALTVRPNEDHADVTKICHGGVLVGLPWFGEEHPDHVVTAIGNEQDRALFGELLVNPFDPRWRRSHAARNVRGLPHRVRGREVRGSSAPHDNCHAAILHSARGRDARSSVLERHVCRTSADHVVAIPDFMPNRVFMYSDDAGLRWAVHRCAKWPRHRA
jgi:hypothetical protein